MMDAATRARAVAAACGHDLNNELTIIFAGIAECIEMADADDPIRPFLLEMRAAAQRCAWKASGLLNFAARGGGRSPRSSMETLIDGNLL
ncbi:MAG: hypothetical protein ABSB88_06075 [Bryobacteraceae bacterium]|jgi:hypothetical protein